MASTLDRNYKLEYARYRHYFHRIWKFYEKPAAKVSAALLLTIFTTIFFAVFAIRPTLITITELLREIEHKTELLDKMKRKSAALASAQQEYTASQHFLTLLDTAVPNDYQIQSLLKMIEGTAAHHNLAIHNLSTGDVEYQKEGQPQAGGIQVIPVTIGMETDYPNLKLFLSDLVKIPRIIFIDSVTFAEPTRADGGAEIIRMTVKAQAYYLPQLLRNEGNNSPSDSP